jgi:hypothetical protein
MYCGGMWDPVEQCSCTEWPLDTVYPTAFCPQVYAGGAGEGQGPGLDEYGFPTKWSRVPDAKKHMEVLQPLDHASLDYPTFRKDFYKVKLPAERPRPGGGRNPPLPRVLPLHQEWVHALSTTRDADPFESPVQRSVTCLPRRRSTRA